MADSRFPSPAAQVHPAREAEVPNSPAPARNEAGPRGPVGRSAQAWGPGAVSEQADKRTGQGDQQPPEASPKPRPARSLADLLEAPNAASRWLPDYARMRVDEARAAAAGIRKLQGKRLTLYTDLAPDPEIDVLPEVFRQAFPQWCAYFGIDPAAHADWHATGFLIKEKARFAQAGLIPDALPPHEQDGFSWNYDLWVYEQPSAYYRRHLLLHEGTHSFMNTILRGCGPTWYMEGIAELLGTHRWHQGRLTLNHMPANREEVPMWGRIRIVQDGFAAGRERALQALMQPQRWDEPNTEPYGWYWAAAALLDGHPRYRDRFRQLPQFVLKPDFSTRFDQMIGDDWDQLLEEWQVFVAGLEYGYDFARTTIDFTPGRPVPEAGASLPVAADRGWQNSGLRLEAGVTYRVRAAGRYQVADRPQIWWCEAGGVSIRYYHGRPLGMLLGAVRAEPPRPAEPTPLIRPFAVGLGIRLTPQHAGTLFLRINDSAAELDDNAGTLLVHIRAASGD